MRIGYLAKYEHNKSLEHPKPLQRANFGKEMGKEYTKRPADNVSFGGSAVIASSKKMLTGLPQVVSGFLKPNITSNAAKNIVSTPAPEWAKKVVGSKWFNSLHKLVEEKEGVFEAAAALGLAGTLKPLSVMFMPGAKDEDKEQIAAKNFVSAFLGFAISVLVFSLFTDAAKKIVKDPHKYVKGVSEEAQQVLERLNGKTKEDVKYTDTFLTLWKKGTDLVVAPAKTALTVALMPLFVGALFGKKNEKKKAEKLKTEYAYILPTGIRPQNNTQSTVFNSFLKEGGKVQ